MQDKITAINKAMLDYYQTAKISKDLVESITYSIEAGGKRIRPLILLEFLEGFGVDLLPAHFQVAAALEMIHTGSLIHDDLPAMDDDDYRRGQLTNHKKFDEATAILAGDSLFLDPFGLLAKAELRADILLALIRELSDAAGTFGMVAGQVLDMKGEEKQLTLDELQKIHANKTGKLLAFPFVAAGILLELPQSMQVQLRQAGELLGLAFQVRDDILDVTADFANLGKTPKKDLVAEKSTYPSLLGLEQSQEILTQALDDVLVIFEDLEKNHAFNKAGMVEIVERLRLNG